MNKINYFNFSYIKKCVDQEREYSLYNSINNIEVQIINNYFTL